DKVKTRESEQRPTFFWSRKARLGIWSGYLTLHQRGTTECCLRRNAESTRRKVIVYTGILRSPAEEANGIAVQAMCRTGRSQEERDRVHPCSGRATDPGN